VTSSSEPISGARSIFAVSVASLLSSQPSPHKSINFVIINLTKINAECWAVFARPDPLQKSKLFYLNFGHDLLTVKRVPFVSLRGVGGFHYHR